MEKIVDRFIRYAKFNTQSDYHSTTNPSTAKQFDLAKVLVEDLRALGLKDAEFDEKCYIMATLPANTSRKIPTIGWITHLDTSPDMSAENVQPRIIPAYDGKPVVLDEGTQTILSPENFPELLHYVGQPIITTDGKTLLGADDKAGIAVVMTMLQTLQAHPEIEHGTLRIGITPDEETGHGADFFEVKKFGADFAYTVDGGALGELEYECFNGAKAKIHIQGRNVHPGNAKNAMVNSLQVAMDLHAMLPVEQRPEYTEKYEGFFHLYEFNGAPEETRMTYIVRDHDRSKFEHKKQVMRDAVAFINRKLGQDRVELIMEDQYQNMREIIEKSMHIVDTAKEAMQMVGVTPVIGPIRGGTDGARLSYMGLPTPNIFSGGMNYHGKYEYLPIQSLEKAVDVVLKIIELYTSRG